MGREKSCKQRVNEHYKGRIEDVRRLWVAYCNGDEEVEDLGCIYDYGLCFDFVGSETCEDIGEPFFRYQLSTGGPGDEFRFFAGADCKPYRVEYWFLDWFDGASVTLTGDDLKLLLDIFDWFKEGGTVEKALEDARV